MINLSYKYRVYGRKKGRKNKAIDLGIYKKYLLKFERDFNIQKNIILDIGSGTGESTLFLAKKNPNSLILFSDVFEDGNIKLSKKLSELKINNVKFYNKNIIKLFDDLHHNNYFSEIWILFPDPWPKKKHHKRRLINSIFFKKIYPFLKSYGKIYISTDSQSYLRSILYSIYDIRHLFLWNNDKPKSWQYNLNDLPITKFYKKAENSNRSSFFIELTKI
tara:strand:+ start:1330 stop:1986 length:657 start_codon:yes stop_codon:yes gene_type:complete